MGGVIVMGGVVGVGSVVGGCVNVGGVGVVVVVVLIVLLCLVRIVWLWVFRLCIYLVGIVKERFCMVVLVIMVVVMLISLFLLLNSLLLLEFEEIGVEVCRKCSLFLLFSCNVESRLLLMVFFSVCGVFSVKIFCLICRLCVGVMVMVGVFRFLIWIW